MDAKKPPHSEFDTILTLDFGSQYTHLITRRYVHSLQVQMIAANTRFLGWSVLRMLCFSFNSLY